MNKIAFLFVVTACVLIFHMSWVLFNRDPEDLPHICFCYCSDASVNFKDFSTRITYEGVSENASLCTCQDFLMPALSQYKKEVNKKAKIVRFVNVIQNSCQTV
ncbi:hypothetical protein CEXT_23791 [Caerostris extrusa]|uniref:Uncharacterized protein n=1 Tax=Caerostris extrusa TaxID=172846 RepID=A0AAV4MRN4_CAEEX|nr:hypothetical protein CEXT_23791 [Caerostris extrusa]